MTPRSATTPRPALLFLALLLGCGAPSDADPPADTADADTDSDSDADTNADTDSDTSVDPQDADGDGFLPSVDCDDADPAVHPGAAETCNDADDDCDGRIDEDVTQTRYLDGDNDGYGDPASAVTACAHDDIYIPDGTDCDDTDGAIHPGAAEPDCTDPTDYDCDGDVAYVDADGDGTAACEDCDDDDDASYPGAAEVCDGVDQDCDGAADDGVAPTWYGDADGDGFGGGRFTTDACDAPFGYVADATDCDDLDPAAFPGGAEACNGADDDCDGSTDEDASGGSDWWLDADGDGHGDLDQVVAACDAPAGYTDLSDDCDDSDPTVFPAAAEACDGVDHDCDGATNEDDSADASVWYADLDADNYGGATFRQLACTAPAGFLADATDCDNDDASVHPGATEACNGGDDDCDGSTDEPGATGESTWYADTDGDGYGGASRTARACDAPSGGYGAVNTDCDDTRASVSPAGVESCNGRDDNCDGETDESGATGGGAYYPDTDEDGFGSATGAATTACDAPIGYRPDRTDCDDGTATTHPYAYEAPTDGVDNDCDGGTDAADTGARQSGPSGDNSGTNMNFGAMSFPFCGRNYTSAYMQSNGRITFASNDTDSTEAAGDLPSDIMVAAAWDDFRPDSGTITESVAFSDAVGFYWVDLPEPSAFSSSTFSIVLFDDGRILLQYEGMDISDGLAGWSCGSGGGAGSETDFSATMDALPAGRWGLGDATESTTYESFSTDFDLADRVIRLCGNVDDVTDPCSE